MNMKLVKNYRFWLAMTAVALIAGNVIGWFTVVSEITDYCKQLGGIWALTDFSGNIVENPLLTPCFYGSIAFLIALVWNIYLLRSKDDTKIAKHFRWFITLLVAGTVFAAVNNVPIFQQFYSNPENAISCSGKKVTNPYLTSCFLGFSGFFSAMIFSIVTYLRFSKQNSIQK